MITLYIQCFFSVKIYLIILVRIMIRVSVRVNLCRDYELGISTRAALLHVETAERTFMSYN